MREAGPGAQAEEGRERLEREGAQRHVRPGPSRAARARGRDTAGRCPARRSSGLLSGGAHRTAAVTKAPVRSEPVAAGDAGRLAGVAGPVERPVEPVARTVAGEHPPGPVAAVGGRRQADHHEARRGVAETRHRPRPVGLVGERASAVGRHLFAPGDQPRAAPAALDLGLQLGREGPASGRGRPPAEPTMRGRAPGPEDEDARRPRAPGPSAPRPSARPPSSSWSATASPRPPARCCPAGPRGCTSPRRGGPRPSGQPSGSRRSRPPPTAVYASPMERTRETAAPIAQALRPPGADRQRPPRLRGRRVGGQVAPPARPQARVADGASAGRPGSGSPAASRSPRCRPGSSRPSSTWPRRTRASASSCVSHADPIQAADRVHRRGPARHVPARSWCRRPRSRPSLFGPGRPTVLCVNSTGSLGELVAVVTEHDIDPPDEFTVGTVGPVGERTFLLQSRRGPSCSP